MIRGWCPSLHEPMATGDGLLVRVKPKLGRVPAEAARALAAAAIEHGNGAIELTGRGALQFRGLTAASAARFADLAVDFGLAVADPAGERRRSILVSPLAGLDPAVAPHTADLATALETAILANAELAALPAKFCFAVDGGGLLPLGDGADVSLLVEPDHCLVVPAGSGQAAVVGLHEAVPAVVRLAHAFLAVAGEARRMHRVVAARVFAAAGLREVPYAPASPGVAVGPQPGAFGAGLLFGSLSAATLAGLAALGALRLTPWRTVLIEGPVDPAAVEALGLIAAPDHKLLAVSACPGQPGCASASVDTRGVAARLRPAPGTTIHVSGCSKGCAHPGPATLTFVGRDGRFDVVRQGRADGVASLRGLHPAELIWVQ